MEIYRVTKDSPNWQKKDMILFELMLFASDEIFRWKQNLVMTHRRRNGMLS